MNLVEQRGRARLFSLVAFGIHFSNGWLGHRTRARYNCHTYHGVLFHRFVAKNSHLIHSSYDTVDAVMHRALRASTGGKRSIENAMCAFLEVEGHAAVFWHANRMPSPADAANSWFEVVSDQLQTLNRSVLTACGVPVCLSIPEGAPWPVSDPHAASFLRPAPRTTRQWSWGDTWEEEKTLAALFEYCLDASHTLDIVAYTHDRGTRIPRTENPGLFATQWARRRRHEYFLFVRPEGCVSALRSGAYDTCGSDFRELGPFPHYSGTFWWATCQHIRRLPHPMDYTVTMCPYPPDQLCEGPGRQPPTFYDSKAVALKDKLFLGPEFWLMSLSTWPRVCMHSGTYMGDEFAPPYEGHNCSGDVFCYPRGLIRIIEAFYGEKELERNVTGAEWRARA